MAFVLQQYWEAGGEPYPPRRSAPPPVMARLLGGGRDLYFRKGSGTLLTAIVHVLLIWVFMTKLTGSLPEEAAEGAPPGRMMRFDLPAQTPAGGAETPDRRPVPAERPSEVDATARTPLPPPEWSVARIAAAQASAAPAAPAEAQPGAGGGAGSGGSGLYDPFAGAAPLSRERVPPGAAAAGSAAAGSAGLDQARIEAARRQVQAALPGVKGTMDMIVSVSAAGDVLDAVPQGGSASAAAKEAFRRALIGARLFGAGGPRRVALPRISFG